MKKFALSAALLASTLLFANSADAGYCFVDENHQVVYLKNDYSLAVNQNPNFRWNQGATQIDAATLQQHNLVLFQQYFPNGIPGNQGGLGGNQGGLGNQGGQGQGGLGGNQGGLGGQGQGGLGGNQGGLGGQGQGGLGNQGGGNPAHTLSISPATAVSLSHMTRALTSPNLGILETALVGSNIIAHLFPQTAFAQAVAPRSFSAFAALNLVSQCAAIAKNPAAVLDAPVSDAVYGPGKVALMLSQAIYALNAIKATSQATHTMGSLFMLGGFAYEASMYTMNYVLGQTQTAGNALMRIGVSAILSYLAATKALSLTPQFGHYMAFWGGLNAAYQTMLNIGSENPLIETAALAGSYSLAAAFAPALTPIPVGYAVSRIAHHSCTTSGGWCNNMLPESWGGQLAALGY